jgi:putative chitinase
MTCGKLWDHQFDVTTPMRVAAFVAQCAHESADFTVLSENLNYSSDALNKLFGKYFVRAGRDATPYHRKPELIANVIYASRMGNGDTNSGEGYKFRGRGPIQLTGKDNYWKFANDFFEDPETVMNDPDLVTDDIPTSLYSALWFWNKNNLNKYADSGDIKGMTKVINGGYIGLEDRIKHYNHAIEVLTA